MLLYNNDFLAVYVLLTYTNLLHIIVSINHIKRGTKVKTSFYSLYLNFSLNFISLQQNIVIKSKAEFLMSLYRKETYRKTGTLFTSFI